MNKRIPSYLFALVFILTFSAVHAQFQRLVPNDSKSNQLFGYDVAIDGNVAAVSAINDGDQNSGAVYIFEKINNKWIQTDKILPQVLRQNGQFGLQVLLDNGRLIIFENDNFQAIISLFLKGAGDKFTLRDSEVVLTSGSGSAASRQANLHLDGNQLTVSVVEPSSAFASPISTYVLSNSDIVPTGRVFSFSSGVAEGWGKNAVQKRTWVCVSEYLNNIAASKAGLLRIYDARNGDFENTFNLEPKEPIVGLKFGFAQAAAEDIIAVSAIGESKFKSNNGAVYVIERFANGLFTQHTTIYAPETVAEEQFGGELLLKGDKLFVANKPLDSRVAERVYAYNMISKEEWEYDRMYEHPGRKTNTLFGFDFDVDVEKTIIGAPIDSISARWDGAAYIFDPDIISNTKPKIAYSSFISCHPNPAHSSFYISSKEEGRDQFDIQLIDLQGRSIMEQANVRVNQSLSISHIPSGQYFILFRDRQGEIYREPLVINR